jgi:hypothetical protein
MSEWVKAGVRSAYMKIAEPRVIRIIQFFIYSLLFVAGILVLINPPRSLEAAAGGQIYVVGFGLMLMIGALSSGVAVLPGIWWLERAGLVLLGFGLLIYLVMAIKLQSSPMGIVVCMILTLSFVQRWLEIKGAQLAPLLPKKRG